MMLNVIKRRQNGVLIEHTINGVAQPITEAMEPRQPERLPYNSTEWPVWAKGLKLLAKPEDKGIGDVVARMIGAENSAGFKAWHLKTFGKSCGCTGRQARWNRQFPL